MTHELAVVENSSEIKESGILLFQSTASGLTTSGILHGKTLATESQFCRAHLTGCKDCQTEACERCCFQFGVPRNLQQLQLIVKTSESQIGAIWLEGQIQQRLYEQFPQNVARCIGRYEDYRYYIRKRGASNWTPVKISVYVQQNGFRSRHSSVDNLTLSAPREFNVKFDEFSAKIRDSLLEMAILFNRSTLESSSQLRIDWMDTDFLRKHNYFIVPSDDDDGRYTYVFFDFGCNIKLSPL